MGGRRFAEGLYKALFSIRLARRNVIIITKRKFSLISVTSRAKHCYGRAKNCPYQCPVVSLFSIIVICLLDNNWPLILDGAFNFLSDSLALHRALFNFCCVGNFNNGQNSVGAYTRAQK